MEFLFSLEDIVKILFLPFLLLIIGGMTVFVLKHKKLLEDRKIVFIIVTILVMTVLRLLLVGSVASRYYIALLIPGIPFAAYLLMFPPQRLNLKILYLIFSIVIFACIVKALKPRRPKAYIRETSSALVNIIRESKDLKQDIYDFSGEVRHLRFYSNLGINNVGKICEAPDRRIPKLFELIISHAGEESAIYFIFRSKGLEVARKAYQKKNRKPLPLKEIFRSKSKRNDGGSYVIVRLSGSEKMKRSSEKNEI